MITKFIIFLTDFNNIINMILFINTKRSGSYGFDKYGEDVVFYKLYNYNNLDGTHAFEITDNVSKQIKEINNDLYYLKSLRNVALYLDNEE